jgi:hypothetical protein
MKKFFLILAATFFLGVSCFASSISLGPGFPGQKCVLPPLQTTAPSTLIDSVSVTSFRLSSSLSTTNLNTNLNSSLTTAANLLSQTTAPLPLAAPPTPADSSLAINTIVPEFTSKAKGATPTSEPSSLLFLAVGLLFLPFLRKKHAAKRSLRLRMA